MYIIQYAVHCEVKNINNKHILRIFTQSIWLNKTLLVPRSSMLH